MESAMTPTLAFVRPLIAISTLLFGYLISSAIYNLWFHPLSKVPGPLLARFSRLPTFYHAIKGDRHVWIWQCHQIYGDKVRVQPNEVLFLAEQAYRDIYGSKGNTQRSKSYKAWQTSKDPNTALTTDRTAHAQKRRILNQAFTEKSIKSAAFFVAQHTERWLQLLASEKDSADDGGWTKSRNMSDWNNWLVFDILGDICFGRSFEIKEPGPNPIRVIPRLVQNHVLFFYPVLQSPIMEFFVWAKPRGLDRLLNLIAPPELRIYYDFINSSVSQRIQIEREHQNDEETARLDMFHFLCAARDPVTGQAYSEDTLQGEAAMLIVAGTDSTSAVLAAFWFYISRNKHAYTSIMNEICSTFESSEDIVSGPKLQSCVYVWACIEECMRIAPAGPSEFAREVLPGGTIINGEHFPAGTLVGCGHWAMGRNDEVYGDPHRFRPERYIPSEKTGVTAEDVKRLKSYYHPFLIGPTNCVGQNIAMMEMALIICKTLFGFELRAVPGEDLGAGHAGLGWGRRDKSQYQIVDAYITVHDGPMVQFRKRKA